MKKKIIISTIVAFLISCWLSPAEPVTELTNGVGSALLCCAALLILARRKFVKSSPNSMHTLVCILVCMLSILSVRISLLFNINRTASCIDRFANSSVVVSSVSSSASHTGFAIGNLWIVNSSDCRCGLSKETEYVICSVDIPKTCRYDGSVWTFAFSDDTSTGFSSPKSQTFWIDKQHKSKPLGPILNKEDVLLIHDHRYDEEFKISSPEELLEIVNKLKAEQAASGDATDVSS